MRKTKQSCNLLLCFLLNLFLNFEGLIPAAILLALHFLLHISCWWAVLVTALWIVQILLYTLVIGWANKCGNAPDKPKENKNPYSATNKSIFS